MTADIELLPCPFCGGKASMRHIYHWWVKCVSCGADTPDSAPLDEDGAAAAWNTRANVAHATAAKDYALANTARSLGAARAARDEAHARAERLAEVLRSISELDEREGDSLGNARSIARAALRDHDKEVGNG